MSRSLPAWVCSCVAFVYLTLGSMGVSAAPIGLTVNVAQAADPCGARYRVVRGDTLSLIADRLFGDVLAFRRLYELNREVIGPDPATLEVGTVLKLPCDVPGDELVAAPIAEEEPDPGRLPEPIAARPVGLITAAALAPNLPRDWRIQLIDIRPAEEAGPYLPRALSLPRERWPEGGSAESAARFLSGAGLRLERPMVVAAADGSRESLARAAYVVWFLRAAGASDVSLLAGGQAAWRAANFPLWAGPASPEPRRVTGLSGRPVALADAAWDAVAARRQPGQFLAFETTPDGHVKAMPLPDIVDAVAAADQEAVALAALDWIKAQNVSWESEPVFFAAEDADDAALAWLLSSGFAAVENTWLLPVPLSQLTADTRENDEPLGE